MKSVFVVQHLHNLPNDSEDIKFIGVYSSKDAAVAAVDSVKTQPGFLDHPNVVNPEVDDKTYGFSIDEYKIDATHWKEGFVTV